MNQIPENLKPEQRQEIEKKFQSLKEKTKDEQWNSAAYLKALSEEMEETDRALAKRILVRADNLNKIPKNQSKPVQAQVAQEEKKSTGTQLIALAKKPKKIKHFWLILFVIFPSILFFLYQTMYAAKRYESRAQLIVQQPDGMATMDASMALLSGIGIAPSTTSDAQLVKAYIYSNDMLDYLEKEVNITEHFLTENHDIFSKLNTVHTQEELFNFYEKMVVVEIDSESSVITISSQAYQPDFAKRLTEVIVQRAEWYINQIGNKLAEQQLTFIRGEHIKVEEKLFATKEQLLSFQEKYNLLDPEAEGMALQQITYGLEAKLAEKQAELSALISIMSNSAPQVKALRNEVKAIQSQLNKERARLSTTKSNSAKNTKEKELSVGAIVAKFAELKINLELALKAFTASEISLEKARMETYRKLKYLVVVESPTLPEDNRYPNAPYNITLFILLSLMLYGIGRLLIATIKEIK